MGYGFWSNAKDRGTKAFDEKAYEREALPAWDAKWHELSAAARAAFLRVVKGPAKVQTAHSIPPSVASDRFDPGVLKELADAQFVEVQQARSKGSSARVIANPKLFDFATRMRSLERLNLLFGEESGQLLRYVDYSFNQYLLYPVLCDVLSKVGVHGAHSMDGALRNYVMTFRWPGWVAKTLKDPLAERIISLVEKADGPIPLVELPGKLAESDPEKVRATLAKLISHLVLFEDLKPGTWELMVGMLPSVREQLIRASKPRERPPLVVCEHPKKLGPPGSVIVNDLRAFLLEVASEPPRLRRDLLLFATETKRFESPLDPLPAWFLNILSWSQEERVDQATVWARALGMVKDDAKEKPVRLRLTPQGHEWLSSGLEAQYATVYAFLTHGSKPGVSSLLDQGISSTGFGLVSDLRFGNSRFLGGHFTAIKFEKGKRVPDYWDAKPADHQALRKSLDSALSALKPGVFYRLDTVEAHLSFKEHNPLNVGLATDEVIVYRAGQAIPPLEELRELAGRHLIDGFMSQRLIPLGCVQVALDENDHLCVAREPRMDAYFGRKVEPGEMASAADDVAKVVVQPDFSVIVIGLNPSPAADLAPFCERTTQGSGQGAMVLKLTRDSVVKAVSNGLKPAEILDRLKRHSTSEIPPNVLREVANWSNWVRQVSYSTLTVLRCPDADTAHRVVAALKSQAERINDTLVALDQRKLTTTERNKLRGHGIIIQDGSEALKATPKPKTKKKKKNRLW